MGTSGRRVVRLVVASPDGRRVLARPNGLAGWSLPTIPVDGPLEQWDRVASERAEAALGTAVEPVRLLATDAWVVRARGRISAAGAAWISEEEAGRVGGDAGLVRRWAADARQSRDDTTGG